MAETRPDRIDQILEAAVRLFAEQGYHSTSMDDLVAESGLSKGSLYWHFDSKDDIILAVLERVFDRELYHLEALLDAEGPAADRLRALALLTADDIASQRKLLALVFESYSLTARRPAAGQAIRDYLARYQRLLSQMISAGQEQGDLRPGDSSAMATAIIASFEGLLMLWALEPEGIDLRSQVSGTMEIILRGITAEPRVV